MDSNDDRDRPDHAEPTDARDDPDHWLEGVRRWYFGGAPGPDDDEALLADDRRGVVIAPQLACESRPRSDDSKTCSSSGPTSINSSIRNRP